MSLAIVSNYALPFVINLTHIQDMVASSHKTTRMLPSIK